MIIVDSSVWIANLRALDTLSVRKLRSIEDPEAIAIGDLILLEVLQGARDDQHAARIERDLRHFKMERMLDDGIAVRAASNYRRLRDIGITMRKTIDVIIGTFCIERGHLLLHDDRDFEPMAKYLGLQVA